MKLDFRWGAAHHVQSVFLAGKSALTNDPRFTAVCAPPRFVEGAASTAEPLVMAAKVSGGKIGGDAWNSRPALETARRERDVRTRLPEKPQERFLLDRFAPDGPRIYRR